MTKQEVIQKAYGEYWEDSKKYIDEDGYVLNKKMIKDGVGLIFLMPMDVIESPRRIRPKSLAGIENNNGWIKIESAGNNLNEDQFYFVFNDGVVSVKQYHLIQHEHWLKYINYYQPIEKPKPPIY